MQETNDDVQKKAKRFSIGLLVVLFVFAGLLYLFWQITDEIVFEKETGFDNAISSFFSSIRNPTLTKVMTFFTFFGSRGFLLPAYGVIVAYFLFYKRKSYESIGIASIALGGAGILFILKNAFRRNRPLTPLIEHTASYSYPSGHSFSAFTFCGILIYLTWISKIRTTYKWIFTTSFFLFATLIATTRVYLHVHFASDVIAGLCISWAWLVICYFILKKMKLIEKIKE